MKPESVMDALLQYPENIRKQNKNNEKQRRGMTE
jgi:hypothetical protein